MTAVPRDCSAPAGACVSFEAARLTSVALCRPHGRIEEVPLAEARGRILAQPILAPHALPPFDQAAMDGYAIEVAERDGHPRLLPVDGQSDAGDPPAALRPGTARRIMTGAALPLGANAVVMQEHVRPRGAFIEIPSDVALRDHVRSAGEDVCAGTLVLAAGKMVGWPEVALLAAFGIATVPVAAPVRVAVLTTGSELRQPGETRSAGGVYDSNGPMLAALLASPAAVVTALAVGDELDAVVRALDALASGADLVITTAGMADGDRDHVRAAVGRLGGELSIVKVAMKPGKPLALGGIGRASFVGLPGNPQAAAFAALAFVRPMIAALAGAAPAMRLTARPAFPFTGRPGRTELVPVRLNVEGGRLVAHRSGPDGSHRLLPMVAADAVAVFPGTASPAASGAPVEVLPFDQARFQGQAHADR